MVGRRPLLGGALELVGVRLSPAGSDALGGDLQTHDCDHATSRDDHGGGFAIGGPGEYLGPAADDRGLRPTRLEQAPHELRDRDRSFERLGACRNLPSAIADGDRVLGEQAYELIGLATGGGREKLLDDPLGGGLVDVGAGFGVRDMLLGTVKDLLAGGLGESRMSAISRCA